MLCNNFKVVTYEVIHHNAIAITTTSSISDGHHTSAFNCYHTSIHYNITRDWYKCTLCNRTHNHSSNTFQTNKYGVLFTFCKKSDKILSRIFDVQMSKYPEVCIFDDFTYTLTLIGEINKGGICIEFLRSIVIYDVVNLIMRYYMNNIFCIKKLTPLICCSFRE